MATAASRGRKKNLNNKSIERISGFLGRIFKVAQEMKLIEDIPIKRTLLRINAEQAGHHEALSDAEIARVKNEIPFLKSRSQRLYMTLLVYLGMRPEEVMGLKWEDIHLNHEKPHAIIVRAVTYPDNNKPIIGAPKTKRSGRTAILPEKAVKILQEDKKEHGFICGNEKPWCYSNKERVSNGAFKRLGIEHYTDYDFRTTFGTQLRESGVSSAIVADLMGHADTRMVETIYARTRHEGVLKQYDAVERIS